MRPTSARLAILSQPVRECLWRRWSLQRYARKVASTFPPTRTVSLSKQRRSGFPFQIGSLVHHFASNREMPARNGKRLLRKCSKPLFPSMLSYLVIVAEFRSRASPPICAGRRGGTTMQRAEPTRRPGRTTKPMPARATTGSRPMATVRPGPPGQRPREAGATRRGNP
jgi:hypothetical protein